MLKTFNTAGIPAETQTIYLPIQIYFVTTTAVFILRREKVYVMTVFSHM